MSPSQTQPPKPNRLSRLRRLLWRMLLASLLLVGAGLGVGITFYKENVLDQPGAHIDRKAILEVIAQESPILYADGLTRMGVFFAQEHRQYVDYNEIPEAWVDAIVAAEDNRFFEHQGVDPMGIARAIVKNVRAGRTVAGGSTLTQQTAKNLYYRPDRSLRSKWEELVNALRLEAHYDKREILEFYANQFHVSANGRGLGIAARYFFDKEVKDLSTLECAYIAGMVKGPANYNPFVGASEERRSKARQRAQDRTRYVLDRMLSTGRIAAADHAALIQEPIPFRKGTFRYDSNILVDEVAARLEQHPFPQIFEALGIQNPSTAGIQVVTTIDERAQREATWGLWHHLSEVGPLLEGAQFDALRLPSERAPKTDPDRTPTLHEFRTGTVQPHSPNDSSFDLDLGGHLCRIDEEAVSRMATVFARVQAKNRWAHAEAHHIQGVVGALPAGSVVWASIREIQPEDGTGLSCDLELRPELQGAVLLLEQGQIRAMVGGNDNRNFNRAIEAKRQLGSTWKPLIFHAAMELGWTPSDQLDNRVAGFVFENSWYFPRPDHVSEPFVSLSWAGTRSENLASIWLLVHLSDHLSPAQFKDLADRTGMRQGNDESFQEYLGRIRDTYGIVSGKENLPEIAYFAVRKEIMDELDPKEAMELGSLNFGRGAETEAIRIQEEQGPQSNELIPLARNFLALEKTLNSCVDEADALVALAQAGAAAHEATLAEEEEEDSAKSGFRLFGQPLFGKDKPAPVAESPPKTTPPAAPIEVPSLETFPNLKVRPWHGALEMACGKTDDAWAPVSAHLLASLAAGNGVPLGSPDDMWVDGTLRRSTIRSTRRAMVRRLLVLQAAENYGYEVLQYHPDFRILVHLRFINMLAKELGVQSDLPPVLSLPLGAVDLSLEEAATMYEGMLSGDRWSFPGRITTAGAVPGLRSTSPVDSPETPTSLIAEIRDQEGNIMYRAIPESTQVADPVVGRQLVDVLRNVVKWGTGQRAARSITLDGENGSVPVPVGGKTGTTNGYRNSAFCGYVPRADGQSWGPGYTLVSYVGYDDNRSMTRGGVRISGASGALPAWIGAAQGLAAHGLLGKMAPEANEWPTEVGFSRIPVVAKSGLPQPISNEPDVDSETENPDDASKAATEQAPQRSILVAWDGVDENGQSRPERLFVPSGIDQSTTASESEPIQVQPTDISEHTDPFPSDLTDTASGDGGRTDSDEVEPRIAPSTD